MVNTWIYVATVAGPGLVSLGFAVIDSILTGRAQRAYRNAK